MQVEKVKIEVQHKDVTISWQQYDALLESANEVLNALKPFQSIGNDGAYRLAERTIGMRLSAWINNLVAINPYAKAEECAVIGRVYPEEIYKERAHLRWEDARKNGKELKTYLCEKNVTPEELAEEIGKSKNSVYSFMRNCTDESLKTLKLVIDMVAEKKNEPKVKYIQKEDFLSDEEAQRQGFKWESVLKKWNEVSPYKIREIKGNRKTHFLARIKKHGQKSFNELLVHISKSDFLLGKCGRNGEHKNFRADFDWVMKEPNYVKVLEGKYDNCL